MDDHGGKTMVPWMITEEKQWCHGRSWTKNFGAVDDHGEKPIVSLMIMEEKPWCHG